MPPNRRVCAASSVSEKFESRERSRCWPTCGREVGVPRRRRADAVGKVVHLACQVHISTAGPARGDAPHSPGRRAGLLPHGRNIGHRRIQLPARSRSGTSKSFPGGTRQMEMDVKGCGKRTRKHSSPADTQSVSGNGWPTVCFAPSSEQLPPVSGGFIFSNREKVVKHSPKRVRGSLASPRACLRSSDFLHGPGQVIERSRCRYGSSEPAQG